MLQCRNHQAHARDKGYPAGRELFSVLNQPLGSSLVEVLLMEPVQRAMVQYPWARPSKDNPEVTFKAGRFVLRLAVQNQRYQFVPPVRVTSATAITEGDYLVRLEDQTLYVPFQWGSWPQVPKEEAAEPAITATPARDDRLLAAEARYETRYREYLMDGA